MSAEHANFSESVRQMLNSAYTNNNFDEIVLTNDELGLSVTITNVARREVKMLDAIKDLLEPVGTFTAMRAETPPGDYIYNLPKDTDLDGVAFSLLPPHVHTHDGTCVKSPFGMPCP